MIKLDGMIMLWAKGFILVDRWSVGCNVQALVCSQARDSSAACTKKAYCVWDVDPFDRVAMCMHKDTAALGSDEFSKEYLKIKVSYHIIPQ
jgi:hypothetical protein